MMTREEFTVHACEQVLRFGRAEKWDDLSEEVKVQLGFNMGVMALGLGLSKEEGFMALANVRQGNTSMSAFRDHVRAMVDSHEVAVDEANVFKSF